MVPLLFVVTLIQGKDFSGLLLPARTFLNKPRLSANHIYAQLGRFLTWAQ